jgi:hypothetical protein
MSDDFYAGFEFRLHDFGCASALQPLNIVNVDGARHDIEPTVDCTSRARRGFGNACIRNEDGEQRRGFQVGVLQHGWTGRVTIHDGHACRAKLAHDERVVLDDEIPQSARLQS